MQQAVQKKKGGPCSPGGSCYGFPGYTCTICCTVFSLWGVLTLVTFGSLLSYRGVSMGKISEDKIPHDRTHVYIAAALYAAFVLGCGGRWIYLQAIKRKNPYHPAFL